MDWKKTLAAVAPTIAAALGSPLAGAAVLVATKALGLSENTEEALQAAVMGADPDALARLKEIDNQFRKDMRALDVDIARIDQADRVSARDLAKANMWPQILLSIVFVGGYFGAMLALHGVLFETSEINPQIIALFGALIGVFTRELSGIMTFWFGSSSGSKEKAAKMGKDQ